MFLIVQVRKVLERRKSMQGDYPVSLCRGFGGRQGKMQGEYEGRVSRRIVQRKYAQGFIGIQRFYREEKGKV